LELMIFRSLLLWHITPVLLIAVIAGLLEGRGARANLKGMGEVNFTRAFLLACVLPASIHPVKRAMRRTGVMCQRRRDRKIISSKARLILAANFSRIG